MILLSMKNTAPIVARLNLTYMIESKLHCNGCYTLAKANQIVHSGLDGIVESLVDEIPECDWKELAWRITVGFGGEPIPMGINWDCEPIE